MTTKIKVIHLAIHAENDGKASINILFMYEGIRHIARLGMKEHKNGVEWGISQVGVIDHDDRIRELVENKSEELLEELLDQLETFKVFFHDSYHFGK
jgi:hypothetical protein